jgi:ABC-2 type transport system permease protein
MSLAEAGTVQTAALVGAHGAPVRTYRGALLRQLRAETRLVFGRRRNQILLAAISAIPLLIGIAVKVSPPSGGGGDGPQFLDRITGNGLFLVLTSLVLLLGLFLPVVVGIVAGDAVAGEANAGTLRYLLSIPVRRGRLLLIKAYGIALYAAAVVGSVALVGAVSGSALFGASSFTLLGGQTISTGEAVLRLAGVILYVWLSLWGLLAVGLFISTLTEVPVAAMAGTLGFAILSLVLDSIPQLHAIHDFLLVHWWTSFGTLLRVGPDYGALVSHLGLQVGYVAIFGSLAWARFSNADVTA